MEENPAHYCVGVAGVREVPLEGLVGGVVGGAPIPVEMPAAGWLPLGPELPPTVFRSVIGSYTNSHSL